MLNLFSNILLFHSSTGKDEKKLKYSADLVVPAKALSLALALSLSLAPGFPISTGHQPVPHSRHAMRNFAARASGSSAAASSSSTMNHPVLPNIYVATRFHTSPPVYTTTRGSWRAYAFFALGSTASPSLPSTGSSGPSGGGTGGQRAAGLLVLVRADLPAWPPPAFPRGTASTRRRRS